MSNVLSGSYSVTIIDANGCRDSNSVVLIQPAQVTTIAGLNDTICTGQSGFVTASATGGAGNYYYTWQPLGVTNSGTLTITPPSTTIYTVVAFDQLGCAGAPDTVRAVVYSLTAANIQAIALTPICPGQSTTIYAQVSGITGPLTFSWNNGLGTGAGPFIVAPLLPTCPVARTRSGKASRGRPEPCWHRAVQAVRFAGLQSEQRPCGKTWQLWIR